MTIHFFLNALNFIFQFDIKKNNRITSDHNYYIKS